MLRYGKNSPIHLIGTWSLIVERLQKKFLARTHFFTDKVIGRFFGIAGNRHGQIHRIRNIHIIKNGKQALFVYCTVSQYGILPLDRKPIIQVRC